MRQILYTYVWYELRAHTRCINELYQLVSCEFARAMLHPASYPHHTHTHEKTTRHWTKYNAPKQKKIVRQHDKNNQLSFSVRCVAYDCCLLPKHEHTHKHTPLGSNQARDKPTTRSQHNNVMIIIVVVLLHRWRHIKSPRVRAHKFARTHALGLFCIPQMIIISAHTAHVRGSVLSAVIWFRAKLIGCHRPGALCWCWTAGADDVAAATAAMGAELSGLFGH